MFFGSEVGQAFKGYIAAQTRNVFFTPFDRIIRHNHVKGVGTGHTRNVFSTKLLDGKVRHNAVRLGTAQMKHL